MIKEQWLKKFLALGVSVGTYGFLSTVAFAQPTEYNLKVTPVELDLISEGLQTQPFGKVAPLMNKLRQQIIEQQPKTVENPKPEEKKE